MIKNRSLSVRKNSYNRKRVMYESIMTKVAKVVKDTLNETYGGTNNTKDDNGICVFDPNGGILTVKENIKVIRWDDIPSIADSDNVKQIILPNGLEKIDDGTFGLFKLSEDLLIPESVRIIGRQAFIGSCNNIDVAILSNNINFPVNQGTFCKDDDNLSNTTFYLNIGIFEQANVSKINAFITDQKDRLLPLDKMPHIKFLYNNKDEYLSFIKNVNNFYFDKYYQLKHAGLIQFGLLSEFKAENNIQ